MKKPIPPMICSVIAIWLALGATVIAQNSLNTPISGSSQAAAAPLFSLPEADTMIYVSPHRLLVNAAPRLLSEKDLAAMRLGLGEAKTQTGVDPQNIDYIVIQARFKKPAVDLTFSLPEFLVVASGDFSADAILLLVRQATGDKIREDKYGSRNISLLTIDDIARASEKNAILKSLSEIAVAVLNGNTIVAGTPSYVKAAIDAADGKGRVNPELVNSLMRDPTVLMSAVGSPLTAFAKTFALLGTENNPRPSRCDTKLGDFYASITMDSLSFKLRGAMNADNPDTAKIIQSLLSGLLQQATTSIKDKNAQTFLRSLTITPTENEVQVQADISQQMVADFIREQMSPKKQETTSPVPSKPRRRHRRPAVRRPPVKSNQ